MSERMTAVYLPGIPSGTGLANYGRKTPAEMIEAYRAHAEHAKEWAEKVLAASDDDFCVETYLGPLIRDKCEVLQKGRQS